MSVFSDTKSFFKCDGSSYICCCCWLLWYTYRYTAEKENETVPSDRLPRLLRACRLLRRYTQINKQLSFHNSLCTVSISLDLMNSSYPNPSYSSSSTSNSSSRTRRRKQTSKDFSVSPSFNTLDEVCLFAKKYFEDRLQSAYNVKLQTVKVSKSLFF